MSLARVKQFKDVEISYEAASGFTFKLYTDMPGSSLALRATISFPASSGGRRTYTAPLDGIEGTVYQPEITSTGVVRLYGGQIRVRGIGEYIDGANGEVWKPMPTSIGLPAGA